MSYLDIFNKMQRSNVTLDFEIDNQYIQAAQQTSISTTGVDSMAQISL